MSLLDNLDQWVNEKTKKKTNEYFVPVKLQGCEPFCRQGLIESLTRQEGRAMMKKYIVELTTEEPSQLKAIINANVTLHPSATDTFGKNR